MLSREGHLKCAAPIGIGRCGNPGDLPVLLEALADQDVKVRGACVEALGFFPGQEATTALAGKMRRPTRKRSWHALQAPARRGQKSTILVFMAAAQDADEAVRVAAIAGLGTSAMRARSRCC